MASTFVCIIIWGSHGRLSNAGQSWVWSCPSIAVDENPRCLVSVVIPVVLLLLRRITNDGLVLIRDEPADHPVIHILYS